MGTSAELRDAVKRAILDGKGASSAGDRRRAFDGEGAPGAIATYIAKVRDNAYKITDEDIAALRAAGLDDDRIFELSVAAAVGQATRQYDAAAAALDAALAGDAGPAEAAGGV